MSLFTFFLCDVSGLNTSLVPMYISEIAPLNLRGGLGTVNQLAVTVGLALSQVLGIEQILGTDDGWPILLGLAVCPAVLQLLLLPLCPESPRYLLITKQWEEEARKGEFDIPYFGTLFCYLYLLSVINISLFFNLSQFYFISAIFSFSFLSKP